MLGAVKDFCDAIYEVGKVVSDGINGASTAAICFDIVESFKTGNKVKVDYNFG